jgi:pescadillo protein
MDSEGDGEDNQTSRKLALNQRFPGRIYIQPQWIWDSINDEELKRPDLYAPGAQLPPHLSPFVKTEQGQYDPTVPLEEQQPEEELLEAEMAGDDAEEEDKESDEEGEDVDEDGLAVKAIDETAGSMDVAGSEDEDQGSEGLVDKNSFDGFSDDEAARDDTPVFEELSTAMQRKQELEAELIGESIQNQQQDPKTKARQEAKKALARKAREKEEELERAMGMLSKKKRKRFEQMIYSNNKKSAEDRKIRTKRRKIEMQLAK